MNFQFTIITLFPEMFSALNAGITGKAIQKGLLILNTINPRDFTTDKHRTVDDAPYGGGAGMVMKTEPLIQAILHAKAKQPDAKVIFLSPQGKRFDGEKAKSWSKNKEGLIFIAGRYEGIDQRVIDLYVDEEWSIGDYVLSGGELAAMVMIDSISRCIPGVVGDFSSVETDSFYHGLLKYPQYTRPETVMGANVPEILLSGHHADIAKWRKKQSLGTTWLKKPELLERIALTVGDQRLLNEFIAEMADKRKET